MTKTGLNGFPRRAAGENDLFAGRVVAAGTYIYAPDVAGSEIETRGSLDGDRTRVSLHITGSLLRDFLALMDRTQEEFNQRWDDQERYGFHVDRARRG
ncbi:hypothetical protein [Streptomyces sp. NPDC005423]|uniref:hypothetical protein n=1 Tax=Streptomyces sp. NPDC005423 TaxID=3155343 RepID=UPI0033B509BD